MSAQIGKPNLEIGTVKDIILASRRCSSKFPKLQNHRNACEVGMIPSREQNFTLHTHTDKHKIDYPSPKDIETTVRWKKPFLCIAESVTGRLVCYHVSDQFKKKVSDTKVI